MGELDLMHMWTQMGWVAKAIAVILIIIAWAIASFRRPSDRGPEQGQPIDPI